MTEIRIKAALQREAPAEGILTVTASRRISERIRPLFLIQNPEAVIRILRIC